jgi:Fe2+ or Zn2+ uptake regulation protein
MTTPAERLAWAMSFCKKAQLRMTLAREKILGYLAAHATPVNLDAITQADEIQGHCDATTVYRTLMLLKELDVVRQVSVRHKVRYFVLNLPDETRAYLICRCCGAVAKLPELKSVLDLERQVSHASGYASVYHELELYGICPKCQESGRWSRPSAKLPIRA